MKQSFLVLIIGLLISCNVSEKKDSIFNLLPSKDTGVTFKNELTETEDLNYFTYPYLYMGGGTAIGDFNNDGLEDIFFTGNQVSNKLYINKGDLKFEDITKKSGIEGDDRWYTGVSLVDINSDGYLDVYLSVSGLKKPHKNQLYINNGPLSGSKHITFTEAAEEYGIADTGNSYQGTFFDYDADGDLDLFVINYPLTEFSASPSYYRYKMDHLDGLDSDHLYENVNGKFIDKTKESGLENFGLTISASIADFNNDGQTDIYLDNDFGSPDYLYLNNGDKTFKEVAQQATNHTAMYSMGSDFADFNSDGLLDFIQLDMNPQDNYRSKANMASMNIDLFWNQVDNDLHYQYMHNVFQINSGIIDSIPRFSDVSQITGISSTDWSWSVLAFDVDNDAKDDIFITNGIRRDINNRDFFAKAKKVLAFASPKRVLSESKKIPSQAIPNYLFKNQGDLNFKDISTKAGINQPSFSNGMAYGDMDNDGDLDIVINNIDQEAFIYENQSSSKEKDNGYLEIILKGEKTNAQGIGSRIEIRTKDGMQYKEQMPVRGFQSTSSTTIHFGLNQTKVVDTIMVKWPSGKVSFRYNVKSNQRITIDKKDAVAAHNFIAEEDRNKKLFKYINQPNTILDFTHRENEFDDFKKQVLLPHKMSQFGPAMVIADFNNDNRDDIFFGGSSGNSAALYFQDNNEKFILQRNQLFEKYKLHEGVDAIAFDFDGDNDLDLFVVSGGNEFEPGNSNYKDRLYINNGKGYFIDGSDLLPKNTASGSIVKTVDFDKDGDLDLFIGTRHLPHNYPLSQGSFIYENTEGHFEDVTEQLAHELMNSGMVTDAVWVDINTDNRLDLVVVGEWMEPWVMLQDSNGKFTKKSNDELGLNDMTGWWFSIEKSDIDGDGDIDLIMGNLGDNYKYQATADRPFKVFAKDFNSSGSIDIVLSYPQGGNYYPVRGKQCSSEQLPELKNKYKDYNSFAKSDVSDIYSDLGLNEALELSITTFSSYILQNDNGHFNKLKLPNYAQISSINDILIDDFDFDGDKEILLAGNLYASEVETTRNDASYGCVISFDANIKNMKALRPSESGLFIRGDCKKIGKIRIGKHNYLLATLNNDHIVLNRYY